MCGSSQTSTWLPDLSAAPRRVSDPLRLRGWRSSAAGVAIRYGCGVWDSKTTAISKSISTRAEGTRSTTWTIRKRMGCVVAIAIRSRTVFSRRYCVDGMGEKGRTGVLVGVVRIRTKITRIVLHIVERVEPSRSTMWTIRTVYGVCFC